MATDDAGSGNGNGNGTPKPPTSLAPPIDPRLLPAAPSRTLLTDAEVLHRLRHDLRMVEALKKIARAEPLYDRRRKRDRRREWQQRLDALEVPAKRVPPSWR